MHDTALNNAQMFVETYLSNRGELKLLDIGAQDVTGSIKDVCGPQIKYTGVDFVAGKGVDVVLDDPYSLPFDNATFDAVTASSCFEHSEFFWELFVEMLRILKPNGLMYINAPSNGRFHKYPVDCWRFYPDSGTALVNYARRRGYTPQLLESYVSHQIRVWNDFVCIVVQSEGYVGKYPRRVIDGFHQFDNGRVLRISPNGEMTLEFLREQEIPQDQRFVGWRLNKLLSRATARLVGQRRK